MELQTISQVSKQFRISTRTLRYYEQIGLIQSTMKEDYSYRTYDEDAILRLKQIIVLRKLRIPLKSIAEILPAENTALLIEVFQQSLSEIGDEITALTTIKNVIQSFIERLNIKNAKLQLLDDESLLEIVDSLTTSKINFKEDKTMNDLIKANEKLNKLKDRDVRIIFLPPMTIASIHLVGNGPEGRTAEAVDKFIEENNLTRIKPDFRHFGYNNPDGIPDEDPNHGYERWISIPDDMQVKEPFVKKHFSGGMYAAHMIPMGLFEEWFLLHGWVVNNDKYEMDAGDPSCSGCCGWLEEHLNYINWYEKDSTPQLDLLIHIRGKL